MSSQSDLGERRQADGLRVPSGDGNGNFSAEVVAWMERRSYAFATAMNRKGMPYSFPMPKKRD